MKEVPIFTSIRVASASGSTPGAYMRSRDAKAALLIISLIELPRDEDSESERLAMDWSIERETLS